MVRARATFGIAAARPWAFEQLAIAMRGLSRPVEEWPTAMAMKETTQFVPGLRTVGFGDMQECPPQQARRPARRCVNGEGLTGPRLSWSVFFCLDPSYLARCFSQSLLAPGGAGPTGNVAATSWPERPRRCWPYRHCGSVTRGSRACSWSPGRTRGIIVVALRSDRLQPLWVAGLQ
jgi:hypothetical protein